MEIHASVFLLDTPGRDRSPPRSPWNNPFFIFFSCYSLLRSGPYTLTKGCFYLPA